MEDIIEQERDAALGNGGINLPSFGLRDIIPLIVGSMELGTITSMLDDANLPRSGKS
jgi:hypothetical protein